MADADPPHAQGLDGPARGRRPAGRGHVALAPGADDRGARERGPPARARGVDAELPPGGALRRDRAPRARARRARTRGRAAHGREPARERRPAPARPRASGLPRLRGRRVLAGHDHQRGDARARRLASRRHGAQRRDVPRLRPRRDGVEPARRRARGHGQDLVGRAAPPRRGPVAGRPRDGSALGAPVPGLAGGLPPHRQARPLQLLRGLHPHRRLDVQPARQVAEGDAPDPVAPPDRVAQLSPLLARLAPGPQRLLAPGPGLHRPRREQEGGGDPRLPAARREHPAVRRRPLPADEELRQRHRRREAAGAELPHHGRGDRPLHARGRHLALGLERRGRRAGRRARVLWRHPDGRDALPRRRSSASGCRI